MQAQKIHCSLRLVSVANLLRCFAALIFLNPASTMATTKNEGTLLWVSPAWDKYVTREEIGLYNDLMRLTLAQEDLSVEWRETPWKRALVMVEVGQADMTCCAQKNSIYHQSKYPIILSQEVVMYRAGTIETWKGVTSLKNKNGVWNTLYLNLLPQELTPFLTGTEFNSRSRAMQVFLDESRNIDYYLDNIDQLSYTMAELGISLDPQKFPRQVVAEIPLFMNFTKSERGLYWKQKFDSAIEAIFCSGELEPLYQKHEHTFPIHSLPCAAN